MRSRNFWYEARVWKRQPLAVAASSTPRSFHASRSSSRSPRIVSAPISSSNILRSSEIGRGSCAASSAASSTILTSLGLSMSQLHVDGREGFRLRHLDQIFPGELEHREEIDDEHRHAASRFEQLAELGEAAIAEPAQDKAHVLAHRKLLACDTVVLHHFRTHEERAPRFLKVQDVYLRQALREGLLDPDFHREEVAPELRQRVELLPGELHLFVLEQAPDELGARVLVLRVRHRLSWKEHARLDFHQHRRHDQILGGQLEIPRAHHFDVLHVLLG